MAKVFEEINQETYKKIYHMCTEFKGDLINKQMIWSITCLVN